MTALEVTPVLHPLQPVAACLEVMADALDRVPDGPIPSADTEVLEVVVVEAAKIERQLGELRLRLARAAETGRAEETDASSGADAWLARLTGSTAGGHAWWSVAGADAGGALPRRPRGLRRWRSGRGARAHHRADGRADSAQFVPDADRNEAVRALVAQTVEQQLNTKTLRRRARRMLDIVSRAAADQHEADLLQQEERHARNETWMDLQDNGDGTWSGRFVIPELQAQLLDTYLQHLRAPAADVPQPGRRVGRRPAPSPTSTDNFTGLSWHENMGQALLELCEHLPTDGLASHGRVGATVVIHLDHERLLDGLAAAHVDSGTDISVGEARRLACGAGIIPAVYGGASLPLDVGRESRLHRKAHRIALSAIHDTCATEGCQRPFAWCEIHHPHAWADGGRTDLDNGLPLCGWHHRRAHDTRYDLRFLASGEVRFRRRR